MENVIEIIQQQAEDALSKLDTEGIVAAEHVVDSVLRRTAYWERPTPNGEKLLFVRLFSPVVQREEVFLGNILFNAFLSKAFARAITERKLGRTGLVANDLENYYFLVRTASGMAHLSDAFRAEVERSLPDLFFGEQDEARGIYGSLETMLDFDKANVEPFPVFIMLRAYASRLEKTVRESLLRKIEQGPLGRNPTSIMANLAFFYSHDGAEMQSPYLFLARLASGYGIVGMDDLRQALNLEEDVSFEDETTIKRLIEDSLKQEDGRGFSPTRFRKVLKDTVTNLGNRVDKDPDGWRMPYISSKFLSRDERTMVAALLGEVSLGFVTASSPRNAVGIGCRICGTEPTEAQDKSILMGQNTHKFHNQSGKQESEKEPKACLRCAANTYLMVKLIGSEAIGQPQVPKTYNLIFHYGNHSDTEVRVLAKILDDAYDMVARWKSADEIHRNALKRIAELQKKAKQESDAAKRAKWDEERAVAEGERDSATKLVTSAEDALAMLFPRASTVNPHENPGIDGLFSIQPQESKTERHILGLGMGGYRMILFVLPHMRKPIDPKDKKPHDYSQSRFSQSRVTVTALLSFLRELCGCDGPFYYQSLPALTPDTFQRDTFYVRNAPISGKKAQDEYEVVTQLAWRLVAQRGSDGFVRKVVLAEELLEDPLGTFAAVMRDSPILEQTKGNYRKMGGRYREDWQAQDLTEYAKFIQRLSVLQEVK